MFYFKRFIYIFLCSSCSVWSQSNVFDKIDETNTSDTILINRDVRKTFNLNEIVVTGQIEQQSYLNSVNNIFIIPNTEINNTGSNNLSDLLNTKAIFDISFDPAIGSKSLNIQGMQGNNLNILIDGVPVIGRKDSQIDLSQINLSNIDRIEILKGPGSVSYGTNSTGGVINLISKESVSDQINIQSYFESIGVSQVFIDADKSIGNHAVHLNIGRHYFTGLDNSDESVREQEWREKDQHFGDISLKMNFKKLNVLLKKSIFNEKIIELGPELFFPNPPGTALDLHYFTKRDKNYLKINYNKPSYNLQILSAYSTTRFLKKQYKIDILLDDFSQTDDTLFNTQDEYMSFYNRLELNYLKLNNVNFQIGLDANSDNASGSTIQSQENNTVKINTFSLFSQADFEFGDFIKSQFGIRLPYHSLYNTFPIPSIQFKFDILPVLQFRLSYAKGFRAPSIRELYMYFVDSSHNVVGNPNLDAESSNSFQSSINYEIVQKNNTYLNLNVEAFFNALKNKIDLAEIGNSQVYTHYNLDNVEYYGLNTTISARFRVNQNILSSIDFMWNLYKHNDSSFEYKTPENNISVSYSYQYETCNCGIKINWKIKSKHDYYRLDEDESLFTQAQEGYQLFNSNLFKKFPSIQATLHLGIKNILDVTDIKDTKQESTHSGPLSTISWGRTYFIQLNWHPF